MVKLSGTHDKDNHDINPTVIQMHIQIQSNTNAQADSVV